MLFRPPESEILIEMQRRLLEGESIAEPYDVRLVRSNGSVSILSMTTRLVCEDGHPSGFQHTAIDVTERRRMREVLNHYVKQILTAQEEERKRIARELHDETAQSLLLLLQRMDCLAHSSNKVISRTARKEVEELREVALQILKDLRRLTLDLRPQILDDLGLVAAVEWLAEDMERQNGVRTMVEVIGPQPQLPQEKQLLLFRIVQEALSNVRRHSSASRAKVLLEFDEDKARIIVEDDGQGFELPENLSQLAGNGKLGSLGMFERARLAGGFIVVQSEPGKGTKVIAELAA